MSYNGRKGPNVSEYIASLNAIHSEQDVPAQDGFNFEDDLSMFTNTNFFDFDVGQSTDLQPDGFGLEGNSQTAVSESAEMKPTLGEFNFTDFDTFNRPSTRITSNISPINTKAPYSISSPSSSTGSPPSGLVSTEDSSLLSTPATKRKADSITSPSDNIEEAARAAAEEDKRRRNTAASARFRVKKKQREQALEKSAKQMSDKVAALEGKINQLETENKWLKNLITEKNQTQKEDLQAMYKRFSGEKEKSDRKGDERKDGVGTEA